MNDNNFGERLKEFRLEKGLTLTELAKEVDISKSMLSSYENGNCDIPLKKAISIANYFNVSLDYLAGRKDY